MKEVICGDGWPEGGRSDMHSSLPSGRGCPPTRFFAFAEAPPFTTIRKSVKQETRPGCQSSDTFSRRGPKSGWFSGPAESGAYPAVPLFPALASFESDSICGKKNKARYLVQMQLENSGNTAEAERPGRRTKSRRHREEREKEKEVIPEKQKQWNR